MNAQRIQKAEQLIAEGEKHLKTSLFKWTPDIDSAIEAFDKGNSPLRKSDFLIGHQQNWATNCPSNI